MGFQRGDCAPLAGSRGEQPFVAARRRRNFLFLSAPQGVNSKTVQWTVFEEGTPCKRGRPLPNRVYLILKTVRWTVFNRHKSINKGAL